MNNSSYSSILLAAMPLLFIGFSHLSAAPETAQAYKELQRDHEKALAAAVEPVNRRYITALGDLLRKATQASDLDTAVAIRAELLRLGATVTTTGLPSAQGGTDEGKRAALRAQLRDSRWDLGGGKSVTLHADGSTTASWHKHKGVWKVIAPNTAEISYSNSGVLKKVVFDADATTGTAMDEKGAATETLKKAN